MLLKVILELKRDNFQDRLVLKQAKDGYKSILREINS